MRTYKIAIVEDHKDSREIINRFISYLPNMEVVYEGQNGQELLDFILDREHTVDIVLVDINMPRLNGMEATKLCKQNKPNLKVIFITGYEEYAVEAFAVSAVDYIVKPISQQRLYEALQKAVNFITLEEERTNIPVNHSLDTNKLIIKKGRATFYLPIELIFFIEKTGKQTTIHTKNGVYETSESLDSIEKDLNQSSFYRTHRSYLVNLNHVLSIETYGKTYIAHFANYHQSAHISKLKISEVQKLIQ
ncbi:LytR/AlgR family response regulator transcription factor [Halalkalibacter alkaliphilus]|uniref:LytTR family DNA-binding domain-containing protein n=1 Tax=Halalkalibacter alkaliphilus TaxID=2917993 RepID=A0A9X2I6X0_9BACI|nr:LytTR family DNA-binding domain-containing protein [Halalkalibacter alkaliphilus]MCL7749481.1 LytTR family DNA-binding domain-containing protein [Halalkalibacter alkaliphilus]